MKPAITRSDLDRHLDEYARIMVEIFNHQPSGMNAASRDLGLLSAYMHANGATRLTGDVLLEFISHLSVVRGNRPASIKRKISSIRSYIRYLRFKQVNGADSFPIESLARPREPYPGPVEALLPGEVRRLLEGFDRHSVLGFRDFVLFTLIYRLGLRLGEALAIDISDLDLDLDQEVVRIHGKGRRERTLPLLADLADLIRQWLLLRVRLHRAGKTSALFVSKKGNRLAARTAQESFQKLVAQTGPLSLDKVTPHSLRHAFASHATDGDADLLVLKTVLGHACLSSTEVYLHPSMKVLQKAITDHPASQALHELISQEVIVFTVHQRRPRKAA